MKPAGLVATLALVVALAPAPAAAHPAGELDAWLADWSTRVATNTVLTVELVNEYLDVTRRHPCHFGDCITLPIQRSTPAGPPPPSVESWRPLVAAYFPADQIDPALTVLACESAGNPNANNPTSTAAGLFQFLRSTWDWVAAELGIGSYDSGAVYDPDLNVRAAAWLHQAAGGWSHWVCQP